MKAVLIIPIESLRGKLREDGYYFRMYRGEQIVQKCPRKWVDTPARKAARERFVEKYGRKKSEGEKTKDKTPPNLPTRGGTPAFNAGETDEETPERGITSR